MSFRIETFFGRHFTAICMLGIAAALFAFASFKPTYRLRPEMPRDFVAAGLPPAIGAGEQRVARAYWDSAMLRVQGKYAYGQRLPQEPPREFAISASEFGPAAQEPIRLRYWRQLQTVWLSPGSWHQTYDWDFDWVTSWIDPTQRWLNNHVPGLNNNATNTSP
jgi:hypothetical protein